MSAKTAYNIVNYWEVHATNLECYLVHTGDQNVVYVMNRGRGWGGVVKEGVCYVG